jgi:hypothetical protein
MREIAVKGLDWMRKCCSRNHGILGTSGAWMLF